MFQKFLDEGGNVSLFRKSDPLGNPVTPDVTPDFFKSVGLLYSKLCDARKSENISLNNMVDNREAIFGEKSEWTLIATKGLFRKLKCSKEGY